MSGLVHTDGMAAWMESFTVGRGSFAFIHCLVIHDHLKTKQKVAILNPDSHTALRYLPTKETSPIPIKTIGIKVKLNYN